VVRLIKREQRALKVRVQFGPFLMILGTALCICPLARAQRGSPAPATIAAHPASLAGVAPHPGSMQGSTSSRANVRVSAASGLARSSQRQSISNSINRHRPPQFPNPPRNPVRASGFYLLSGGGTYWVPADSDEAADQQPVDQTDAGQSGGDQSIDQLNQIETKRSGMQTQQIPASQYAGEDSDAPQSAAEQEAQAPLPDDGEFTLVLNDGTWIQAVAFTHSNDSIVYITPAGSRYTIAANELDSDSTLRVNQERGTPLQSPL
jgi:hypothetical protein